MKKNICFRIICFLFSALIVFSTFAVPVFAESTTEEKIVVTVRQDYYTIVRANVAEDYPGNSVTVAIKNDKNEVVEELCLLDITMYKATIELDPGNYTLEEVESADPENFPVENLSFTIYPGDAYIEFKVGPTEGEDIQEITTEESAVVVEKETTEKHNNDDEVPTGSLINTTTSESNEDNTLKDIKNIGTIATYVYLGGFLFIILLIGGIIVYLKKRNK